MFGEKQQNTLKLVEIYMRSDESVWAYNSSGPCKLANLQTMYEN